MFLIYEKLLAFCNVDKGNITQQTTTLFLSCWRRKYHTKNLHPLFVMLTKETSHKKLTPSFCHVDAGNITKKNLHSLFVMLTKETSHKKITPSFCHVDEGNITKKTNTLFLSSWRRKHHTKNLHSLFVMLTQETSHKNSNTILSY